MEFKWEFWSNSNGGGLKGRRTPAPDPKPKRDVKASRRVSRDRVLQRTRVTNSAFSCLRLQIFHQSHTLQTPMPHRCLPETLTILIWGKVRASPCHAEGLQERHCDVLAVSIGDATKYTVARYLQINTSFHAKCLFLLLRWPRRVFRRLFCCRLATWEGSLCVKGQRSRHMSS